MNQIVNALRLHAERYLAMLFFFVFLGLYSATLAPTVSLWDCGEFILCSRWLEVGHAPGAPLYILLGRLFSLFASSPSSVAWCVNLLSAVSTALSVSLVFLISIYLIRWVSPSVSRVHSIIASAVGACAMGVSDTIWFSAVEAEVYALSLFFTVLTLYILLRWRISRDSHLLALIPLLLGLSAGVHLLNMLVIPVVVLVVGLSGHTLSRRRIVVSLLLGFALLAFVVFGLIANGLQPAMILEMLLCVSGGMPVHSGIVLYVILVFATLALILSKGRRYVAVHSCALFLLLFFVGFSTNALIIIRSSAAPSINLNRPDNVFALNSMINRDQYGQAPMLFGRWYGVSPSDIKYEVRFNRNSSGGYDVSRDPVAYLYPDSGNVFLPRMYSSEPHHKYGYSVWTGVDEEASAAPSLFSQLKFLFSYQLNFMYVRYLMWNFAGRQNDIKSDGNPTEGNWISGIPLIDSYLGQRSALHPDESPSRGRAVYFLLPFILGVVGLGYLLQSPSRRRIGYLLLLMFILMGPAIAIYLNQQPFEPRERDYAYAGSFMAFSLFIAFGALAVIKGISRIIPGHLGLTLVSLTLFMSTPMLMLVQNYHSHTRNGRTFDLSLAKAYLSLCQPNAILFTEGDNDTYPLWYAQEVEGYRRDVRVINYGLLGAKWYDEQVARPRRGAKGVNVEHLFYPGADPVYVIPNGNAVDDMQCADNCYDLGLIARVVADTLHLPSPLERANLFLDSLSFPSASGYYQSYDVINTFERSRYRQLANLAAADALAAGNSDMATKILLRSLDVFPVSADPTAEGNIQLALLLHQAGSDAVSKQVFKQLSAHYLAVVNYTLAESDIHLLRSQQYYTSIQPFAQALAQALKATGNTDLLSAIQPYISSPEE